MDTLLKQKKEEFLRTQVNKLCFIGTGGDEYKKSLWTWIEKAIKEAREEGYKEGRKDQQVIDNRIRQAQKEYCSHENTYLCEMYCRDCRAVWIDKKTKLKNKELEKFKIDLQNTKQETGKIWKKQ